MPAIADARAWIDELRSQIADATTEFVAARLTASTLATVEGQLLAEITECERSIRCAAIPIEVDLPSDGDYLKWWTSSAPNASARSSLPLVESVTIKKIVRGTRRFDPIAVKVRGGRRCALAVHIARLAGDRPARTAS